MNNLSVTERRLQVAGNFVRLFAPGGNTPKKTDKNKSTHSSLINIQYLPYIYPLQNIPSSAKHPKSSLMSLMRQGITNANIISCLHCPQHSRRVSTFQRPSHIHLNSYLYHIKMPTHKLLLARYRGYDFKVSL